MMIASTGWARLRFAGCSTSMQPLVRRRLEAGGQQPRGKDHHADSVYVCVHDRRLMYIVIRLC